MSLAAKKRRERSNTNRQRTQIIVAPGALYLPTFGKITIYISGHGQPGNAPQAPSAIGYNPTIPGSVAGYNPPGPGGAALYNPGTPGTLASYNPVTPGNIVGYNPTIPGSASPGNYVAGTYVAGYTNPPVDVPGNIVPSSYVPGSQVPGNTNAGTYAPGNLVPAYTNPPTYTPGNTNQAGSVDYYTNISQACPPGYTYNGFADFTDELDQPLKVCTLTIPGNANPSAYTPGTAVPSGYNPGAPVPGNVNAPVSAPGTYTPQHSNPSTTAPGTVNAAYTTATYTNPVTYNQAVLGNANYNPTVLGNANYNPDVPGNAVYNPGSGGNYASTNPPTGGTLAGANPTSPGNIAGYNPPGPGNVAGYNPSNPGATYLQPGNYVAGNGYTNPTVPGEVMYAPGPVQMGVNEKYYTWADYYTDTYNVVPDDGNSAPSYVANNADIENGIMGYQYAVTYTHGLPRSAPAIAYNPIMGVYTEYSAYNTGPTGVYTTTYNTVLDDGNSQPTYYNTPGSDSEGASGITQIVTYTHGLFGPPGNVLYNPTVPGNYATNPGYTNPDASYYTPGNSGTANYNSPTPGTTNYNPTIPGNANYNPPVAGNANYNPPASGNLVYANQNPGNAVYNPAVPGNAVYNNYVAGAPGIAFNALGVAFPGGMESTLATPVGRTMVFTPYTANGIQINVPEGGTVIIEET